MKGVTTGCRNTTSDKIGVRELNNKRSGSEIVKGYYGIMNF